ncbi:DUF2909 domain-containing protein [Marinobacterium sp. BA1]|uniref:DUF2909 domain-containing protein n=1 Tax=Marinobacterium sp. BA1 TaxID=3138931 RepID=UPI0034E8E5FF
MLHLLIVLLFIAVLIALFSSLWSLLRRPSADGTTANRLLWRVIFSVLLILLLVYGFSSGRLRSHAPWQSSELRAHTQTGTAQSRPHPQNASTRPPLQNRSAGVS